MSVSPYSRQLLFANNAQTTLAGSISNSVLTANLAGGTGVFFPAPGTGQAFIGTFTDAATGLIREIVEVTNVTGDTITMVRAQEGTTALAWLANDLFAELWTAGQATSLLQAYQAQFQSGNFAVDSGIVNAYVITLSPVVSSAPSAGMPIRFTTANSNTGASTMNAGWGVVAVERRDGSALIGNEITTGNVIELWWNGSVFIFNGVAPATSAAVTTGTDTESAITPAQLTGALGSQKLLSGQCYFEFVGTTQCKLIPLNGDNVPVAGATQQVPAAGITVANTGVTINGTGSLNLAASTSYLVALNQSNQLEFWTLATGHSPDSTSGNVGVEVITGHVTKTLIGMVRTDGSANFVTALVLSWFNRQLKSQISAFTPSTVALTSGTVVEVDSSIRNTFLVWAGQQIGYSVAGGCELNAVGQVLLACAFDGVSPELTGVAGVTNMVSFAGIGVGLSEGSHYITLVGATNGIIATFTGGGTSNKISNPAVFSQPASTITVDVMG